MPYWKSWDDFRDRSIHFVVAGDGPLFDQVDTSPLPNVHAVGRLNSSDTAALLMDSDLFCLPTRSEGFSTSLLEAAACGTASLVPDVGGAREVALMLSLDLLQMASTSMSIQVFCGRASEGEFDLSAMGLLLSSVV